MVDLRCVSHAHESWLLKRLHGSYSNVYTLMFITQWRLQNRKMVPKPIHRGFDSLFFLIGWMLWKERNARTFNGVATSATQLGVLIQGEIDTWCLAGYKHMSSLMALLWYISYLRRIICFCLHQNLERITREFEGFQSCAHQGIGCVRIDISWFRYDSRIGSLWMTSADSDDELRLMSGNYISDSTKRERLGSKLS